LKEKTMPHPVPPESVPPAVDLRDRLAADFAKVARDQPPLPERDGAIGLTMFDLPGSADGTITVLLGKESVQQAGAQALVRIESRSDNRRYLGVVSAGPFAEPDSLRADSNVLIAVATRGGDYLPPFHGRIQVTLLGEQLADGSLMPPHLRPLPHSPVYRLSDAESAKVLKAEGDLRLGLAVGHETVAVSVPSTAKSVLPRHTAVLGTTGSGKSTTIAGMVRQAQRAGMAVVLLDVEGEYVHLHEPTGDKRMQAGLSERGLKPGGVPKEQMTLYHLVGRDSANPAHPHCRPFTLQIARLSPYAVMEILDLSDAQQERFLKAYDIAKEVMRDLGLFPAKGNAEQERLALEVDEFERGYPRLTLSLLLDIVGACLCRAERQPREAGRGRRPSGETISEGDSHKPHYPALQTDEGRRSLRTRVHAANPAGNAISWRALLGRLGRLNRLKVFHDDTEGVKPMSYKELLKPGAVSVIDLSDSGMSELNNIVIADLLRGIQDAQEEAYSDFEHKRGPVPTKALLILEEAHEFLSAERIKKMPVLFQQVARLARRGRKRWLGLAFVTQLPQHLPREVIALTNGFILHKINDPVVVADLRRTITGIDEGLWTRLPGLAPGQAIVSFPHMTRPILTSMDPAPCKLRLVD
jgi:DNA helicase HerA-like ATPase